MTPSDTTDPLEGLDPIRLADDFLNGVTIERDQLLALPKALAKSPTFGLGLKVFEKLMEDDPPVGDELVKVAQSACLCAYKNPDVPTRDGLDRGLDILARYCDLHATDDPETLGLAGAICKRKWERQGRNIDLRSSLDFYRRSFMGADWEEREPPGDVDKQRQRIRGDQGYNAINACFMADVFATLLDTAGESTGAERQRQEADRARALILDVLNALPGDPKLEEWLAAPDDAKPALGSKIRDLADKRYWTIATQIEAALGLGRFDECDALIGRLVDLPLFATAAESSRNSWMRETTARQLAKLVGMRFPDPAERRPRELLRDLLGGTADREAVDSLVLGKVGLALSGGGFRAAFYHIGVLAALAELDALRHVEVISTVSGGSILGAAYYVLLKERMEKHGELDRDDFVDIVDTLERSFLRAVQTDLRSELYANLPHGLSNLLRPGKTVGEALSLRLERLFYRPDFSGPEPPSGGPLPADEERLRMDHLLIHPAGDRGFHPRHHNWSRRSKVPLLFINATSLNTGHVWQFTSKYAGESPYAIDGEVDSNARLRRYYYAVNGEVPRERRVPLATAVAASACVPGLFPAVELDEELYAGYGVRLVDGGVHDNQGIVSLLEQDCTQIIVSDACGQMETERTPFGVAVAPLLRTNSIGMERVRQEEYRRLEALRDSSLLGGFLFVHLRQDLVGETVDWKDCEDVRSWPTQYPRLSYGIRRDYQELLAAMRTDLDAFSDVEAWALMYSGYAVTRASFEESLPALARLAPAKPARHDWRFLAVKGLMTQHPPTDARHERFRELLAEGGKLNLRDAPRATVAEHFLTPAAKLGAGLLALLPVAAIALVWYLFGAQPALWTALGLISGGAVAAALAAGFFALAVRRAARAAGLGGLGETVPTLLFAGVLVGARRFSRYHLDHYRETLLERGTVASLDRAGEPDPAR